MNLIPIPLIIWVAVPEISGFYDFSLSIKKQETPPTPSNSTTFAIPAPHSIFSTFSIKWKSVPCMWQWKRFRENLWRRKSLQGKLWRRSKFKLQTSSEVAPRNRDFGGLRLGKVMCFFVGVFVCYSFSHVSFVRCCCCCFDFSEGRVS